MVAAEDERDGTVRDDVSHDPREARAGLEDLGQERALVRDRERLGLQHRDIPAIDDRQPKDESRSSSLA